MYYKVLDKNNCAAQGGTFDYTPYLDGTWTPRIKDTIICKRGYHGTTDPMQHPTIGMRVYAIETKYPGDAEDDKQVFGSISIQEERPEMVPQWWHNVENFIEGLKDIPWGIPQCEPKGNWVMLNSKHAEWDSAWKKAWKKAWDAAWDAAGKKARDAAGDAAGKKARDAAWDAVWDAARDAALKAVFMVCEGLGIPQEHVDFVEGLWDVWQNGYCCCGFKDGQYWVYKTGE
jgi:hypothetical protein